MDKKANIQYPSRKAGSRESGNVQLKKERRNTNFFKSIAARETQARNICAVPTELELLVVPRQRTEVRCYNIERSYGTHYNPEP